MWSSNPKNINHDNEGHEEEEEDDDNEWGLTRAFAEDTRSTNWPPRSYTCTYCRREFRSAQALGGHMNIHRRDRARLNQAQVVHDPVALTRSSTSFGVNYNHSTSAGASVGVGVHQLSNNYGGNSNGFQGDCTFGINYSPYLLCGDSNSHKESNNYDDIAMVDNEEEICAEELDLELRLGHMPKSGGRIVKNKNNVVLPWR